MKNEVAIKNVGSGLNGNYTVEAIVNKILNDSTGNYEDNLKNGIKHEATAGEYRYVVVTNAKNRNVVQGEVIGELSNDYVGYDMFSCLGNSKKIIATNSGYIKFELENFDKKGKDGKSLVLNLSRFSSGSHIIVSKIFLPEYEFFCTHKSQIENLIKQQRDAKEIENEQKRDDEKRKANNLLNSQNDSLEDMEELLEELDKYILEGKLPVIKLLQEINEDLKILYKQKDNLKDKKSIMDCKFHFENAYKEVKKNPNLTDILEQRMLGILRTFFELLGESKESIDKKISAIKFSEEYKALIKLVDSPIIKLQSNFANEKKIDFEQLKIIETVSITFAENKNQIQNKKDLERIKNIIENLWHEYDEQNGKSLVVEENLKKVIKNFYEALGKNELEIDAVFSKQQEADEKREFELAFMENTQKINDSIIQIQNLLETKMPIDFFQFKTIDDAMSALLKEKNRIKDMDIILSSQTKLESLYDEMRKLDNCTENSSKAMLAILDKFYELLGVSEAKKQEILEARKKTDNERELARQIAKLNDNIQNLTSKIRELEILVDKKEWFPIEDMQVLEDYIKDIAKHKDIIQDKSEIESNKIHFDAIYKDCKKRKDFSSSMKLRMKEIFDGFDDIIGKKKGWFRK